VYAGTLRHSGLALALFCGLGLAAVQPASADTVYQFTSVDGPGDHAGGTTINGIDNLGDVVGFSANADASVLTNFIRDPGGNFTVLDLGGAPTAMANGINYARAVVSGSGSNALLLVNGTLTTLPPVDPGKTTSEVALGINDQGSIVGQYEDSASGKTPGFLEVGGLFTIINPVADAMVTNVQGLNNQGQAIGFYSTDGMHQHGFLYQLTTGQTTVLPDPSTPRTANGGLMLTQFLGINDENKAVGYYETDNGSQYGFLFDLKSQSYTYLDAPQAAPVNDVQITQITGINDANQLSGFYIDAGGVQHGFVASQMTGYQP
jgi:hypothetical protein